MMTHEDDGKGFCKWCGDTMISKRRCPVNGQDRLFCEQHYATPFSGVVSLDQWTRPMGHPANPSEN